MFSGHLPERRGLSLLLSLVCIHCFGHLIVASEETTDKKPSAIDEVARIVAYLEFDQQASEIAEIGGAKVECDLYYKVPEREVYSPKRTRVAGTGFVVESKVGHYLVTAKHVVGNAKSTGKYWISPVAGEIVSGTFEELRTRLKGARWFFHQYADVAVHPIVFPPRGNAFKVVPTDRLTTEPVELLTPVCVPGFPHALGRDNIKLGPLVATAEVASWPALLPGSNPEVRVVFLSQRLAIGYSGAPVYTLGNPPSYGARTKHTMTLAGIQSGAYVFTSPTGKQGAVTQDELSCIVPVSYLIELMNSNEVHEFEKGILSQVKPPSGGDRVGP